MEVSLPVSMIGAGNVAWHLAPALENAGYPVKEVYARDPDAASALIKRLYAARPVKDLDFSESPSRVFIMAVSDNAIEPISQEIILPDEALLIHTSGAVSMGSLSFAATEHFGVFYPLQTFTRARNVDIESVPFCIEASTAAAREALLAMAGSLSRNVIEMDTENRKYLHLAAVFANNFTNHMMKISADILSAHAFPPDLLYPLLSETVNKLISIGPEDAQTGPARRRDYRTLDRHLKLLGENEELQKLYRLISQHIADTYHDD